MQICVRAHRSQVWTELFKCHLHKTNVTKIIDPHHLIFIVSHGPRVIDREVGYPECGPGLNTAGQRREAIT